MKYGLTPMQWDTLAFIKTYMAEHGYSPSLQEICTHFGLKAKSGAHRLVGALEHRGYIARLKYANRSIALTPQGVTESSRYIETATSRQHA